MASVSHRAPCTSRSPIGSRATAGTSWGGSTYHDQGRSFVSLTLFVTTGREQVSAHGALRWWLAGPLIAATLHVFEEFVYPGGFREWYAGYRPAISSSLSVRYLVVINAILLTVCALVAVAGPSPNGVANWFVLTSILFWNAIFHVRAVIRRRKYSPGVVTSVVLYLPLAVVGSFILLQSRLVPW